MDETPVKKQIQGHLARNAELIALMKCKGASVDEPRLTECHFFAPTESAAEELATALEARSFKKLRMNPTNSGDWNLEMTIVQPATLTVSEEFTAELTTTAARFNVIYDGWGTSL